MTGMVDDRYSAIGGPPGGFSELIYQWYLDRGAGPLAGEDHTSDRERRCLTVNGATKGFPDGTVDYWMEVLLALNYDDTGIPNPNDPPNNYRLRTLTDMIRNFWENGGTFTPYNPGGPPAGNIVTDPDLSTPITVNWNIFLGTLIQYNQGNPGDVTSPVGTTNLETVLGDTDIAPGAGDWILQIGSFTDSPGASCGIGIGQFGTVDIVLVPGTTIYPFTVPGGRGAGIYVLNTDGGNPWTLNGPIYFYPAP